MLKTFILLYPPNLMFHLPLLPDFVTFLFASAASAAYPVSMATPSHSMTTKSNFFPFHFLSFSSDVLYSLLGEDKTRGWNK